MTLGLFREKLNDFGQVTFRAALANGNPLIVRAESTSAPRPSSSARLFRIVILSTINYCCITGAGILLRLASRDYVQSRSLEQIF